METARIDKLVGSVALVVTEPTADPIMGFFSSGAICKRFVEYSVASSSSQALKQ